MSIWKSQLLETVAEAPIVGKLYQTTENSSLNGGLFSSLWWISLFTQHYLSQIWGIILTSKIFTLSMAL